MSQKIFVEHFDFQKIFNNRFPHDNPVIISTKKPIKERKQSAKPSKDTSAKNRKKSEKIGKNSEKTLKEGKVLIYYWNDEI